MMTSGAFVSANGTFTNLSTKNLIHAGTKYRLGFLEVAQHLKVARKSKKWAAFGKIVVKAN
jgi:type VI secretion system secreted protein VgrG